MNSNQFNVYDTINKLMEELQRKGIPFEYTIDNDSMGGAYQDKGNIKEGSNHTLEIHIGDEEEYNQNGNVNEEKIMGLISTIYHEYRHLEQTEKYKYNPDFSKDSINIARMNAIQTNGLSNYYFENYRNDPKELDATKYGFEEAIKYAKKEFPEINAEKGMTEYVNTYIEEDRNDEYGFHMFDEDKSNTIQEILGQLQERMDNPTRVDLSKVCSGFIEDVKLKALLTDEFIKVYENCSTVEEKDNLIFQEIAKLHPEILSEYPVLQNEVKKDNQNQTMVINGQSIEIKKEKGVDFEKTTRSLNGVEINSTKEFEDGSYDKKSRVFVADKDVKVSNDYINYTSYRQEYDAKTNIYTDKTQSPLIDSNGIVIGEQESIEVYNAEIGSRQINTFSTIENENGNYQLEKKSFGKGEQYKETSTLTIDNKLSGSKEKIQYTKENGKETYIYMENGVIGQKVTKTDRGTTIDIYKDGKPDMTYEYDENGKAIIQMAGLEQLPEEYVKNCFDIAIPDYEVVMHQEPEEIYMVDEIQNEVENNIEQVVSTQKLGKEALDKQKDVENIDEVKQQIEQQMREQSKENKEKFQINEYGEIIRPEHIQQDFRESLKFDAKTTDEYVDEVLTQFEQDLENGVFEQEEMKKKYSHKVEKGDDDYVM